MINDQSTARTLPVTPAERTAAAMLRAWQAWKPDVDDPPHLRALMVAFGNAAMEAGLADAFDLTPAGRDLLARVDAAPMPLPPVPLLSDEAIKSPIAALLWFADEGHYEGTYRKGAGFAEACGMSIARKALGLPVDRPDNTLMPLSEALAGRARMETAERTPAAVLRATLSRLRDAINNPPDGDDNDWKSAMRAALREHEAALAGTTPVDATAPERA